MENDLDKVLSEADKLKKLINKGNSVTVRNNDETSTIKAVAYTWFKSHRDTFNNVNQDVLSELDELYKTILNASDKQTSRKVYASILKEIKKNLLLCRSEQLTKPLTKTSNNIPNFSLVTADTRMQKILSQRWEECDRCLSSKAPLASTVMMGGLLEAMLLSKINGEPDKLLLVKANNAPKDFKTGKTKQLQEWGLKDYIAVAHEMGWISVSAKDVGAVLRDYRNYIHPFKQLSHGIDLTQSDAELFWEITKTITRQLAES